MHGTFAAPVPMHKAPQRNFFVWNKQVAALKSAIPFITSSCCLLSSNPPHWWGGKKKNPRTYSNYLTRRHQGEIKRENVFKKSSRSSAMPLMCTGKRGECPQTLDLSDVTQLPLDYRPLVSNYKKKGIAIITRYCQAQTSG